MGCGSSLVLRCEHCIRSSTFSTHDLTARKTQGSPPRNLREKRRTPLPARDGQEEGPPCTARAWSLGLLGRFAARTLLALRFGLGGLLLGVGLGGLAILL